MKPRPRSWENHSLNLQNGASAVQGEDDLHVHTYTCVIHTDAYLNLTVEVQHPQLFCPPPPPPPRLPLNGRYNSGLVRVCQVLQ